MDKWSTLRQVLEYDLKIAEEHDTWFKEHRTGFSEPEAWDYNDHLIGIIGIYLDVMDELDKEENDGGTT